MTCGFGSLSFQVLLELLLRRIQLDLVESTCDRVTTAKQGVKQCLWLHKVTIPVMILFTTHK